MNDKILRDTVIEIEKGLYDAKLSAHLYKKRIGFSGKGKRGGYRTIIMFKKGYRAFFIYGYSKNQKSNLNQEEKEVCKDFVELFLDYSEKQLERALDCCELLEVK